MVKTPYLNETANDIILAINGEHSTSKTGYPPAHTLFENDTTRSLFSKWVQTTFEEEDDQCRENMRNLTENRQNLDNGTGLYIEVSKGSGKNYLKSPKMNANY